MNLDVRQAGGSLLLVPQFTLVADTQKGNRPGFSRALPAEVADEIFAGLVRRGATAEIPMVAGRFGRTMQLNLSNEGPVTFRLRVPPQR